MVTLLVCASPSTKGPNKGNPATGTYGGYKRHLRAGESPCEACRLACNAYHKEWNEDNPESRAATDRRFYETHREQVNAKNRRYHLADPERYRAHNRASRQRHLERRRADDRKRYWKRDKELRNANQRRWAAANREKARERQRRYYQRNKEQSFNRSRRRRALKQSVLSIPFSAQQLAQRLSMFAGCWICGGEAGTVDHVKPLSKGGADILANLRPACLSCNCRKRDQWPFPVEEATHGN